MKVLDKILETVLGILVAVMVAACFWQVFTRFILNSPSKYTEELLRYMLIWTTMMGVPYAYGKDRHQSVIFCGQFIHAILFCSLLLRLLSFDFSLRIFLAQAGQYLDAP
ncbi:MAG TPA: TRAP transporter small permease subunit, partial [Candidatus Ventrimonas merdavium]|nr:TRAP transporter small permease subunit [Candidatus Ventrimonas merdavium]